MNKKTLSALSIILGVIFVLLAIVYWSVPAGSLPSFVPGYLAGSHDLHFKHGLGSLIVALGLFAFAWFKSAIDNVSQDKKESTEKIDR